jgi:2-keto-4-pentenoate hydratase
MEPAQIAEAASLVAAARQRRSRIGPLPASCGPKSVADAHAIQDAVTARLSLAVGAFKGTAPTGGSAEPSPARPAEALRAPIYAPTIYTSPAQIPAADVPQCGVEGEVAFRFRHDMPPRATAYTREEVAAAVDACAAIEAVTSRFDDPDAVTFLDRLADCINNGGLVHGELVADWRGLDLGKLKVTLSVNGEIVSGREGGHPSGDPLAVVVAVVELMRASGGVTAGQFVTCGSYTGLRYLKPGDTCAVTFEGLGGAAVSFTP